MNLKQAQLNVEEALASRRPDCAILPEFSLDLEQCFVFFYQTRTFLKTRDPMDGTIGHGPVLVCKRSGKIYETGSGYAVEQYVDSFNRTGDPYADLKSLDELGLRCRISIVGNRQVESLQAIKILKAAQGRGLAEVKPLIDAAIHGQKVELQFSSSTQAREVKASLEAIGFDVELL